jgi:hypothetical protein
MMAFSFDSEEQLLKNEDVSYFTWTGTKATHCAIIRRPNQTSFIPTTISQW